ncbi:hypothetical protein TNCV_1041541 [Trichonephila clavipes]|nr:hypothetical protein TNCV_1041541 [Trichonephila clavipes]
MGWTKPHCSSFDRVRLTRYIGASKTAGGKGTRCSGGPSVANAKESRRKKWGKEREWICLHQVGKRKHSCPHPLKTLRLILKISSYHQKRENESAFQKANKTFNLPNNDSSLGIKEFLLLRKEETIFIFCNELETYKALKVSKWTHAGKMIKNVEFKTPNNVVLQETNLARLYDDMSEKIVKESEDFEGRDSGWTKS